MAPATTIVWFRRDLRLRDNPALLAAARRGPVLPLLIFSPDDEAPWGPGAASRVWLHLSLQALDASLRALGSRLVLRVAPTARQALEPIIQQTGARAVVWNRRYEPAALAVGGALEKQLRARGLQVETFNASLLHEPRDITSKAGEPFRVFTPFWQAC